MEHQVWLLDVGPLQRLLLPVQLPVHEDVGGGPS